MPNRPVGTVPAVWKEPLMLDATLWQVDLGDGTWAVCCLTRQASLYRGAKPGAVRVSETHACEPVVPLTTTTRRTR